MTENKEIVILLIVVALIGFSGLYLTGMQMHAVWEDAGMFMLIATVRIYT